MFTELEEQVEGDVIYADFGMLSRPIAVQLTIHVNNLLIGNSEYKAFNLINIKSYLEGQDSQLSFRFKQILDYYGEAACKQWFQDIYDWKFSKEDAS